MFYGGEILQIDYIFYIKAEKVRLILLAGEGFSWQCDGGTRSGNGAFKLHFSLKCECDLVSRLRTSFSNVTTFDYHSLTASMCKF